MSALEKIKKKRLRELNDEELQEMLYHIVNDAGRERVSHLLVIIIRELSEIRSLLKEMADRR